MVEGWDGGLAGSIMLSSRPPSQPSTIGNFYSDPNDDAPDVRRAMFMEVGRVEWNDNKENRFKGRQLQTVELAAGAAMKVNFVKFIIKKNHINRYNEYNQARMNS